MIENLSLGWALRLTGISSTVMLTIASFLIRDRYSSIRPKIHPCDVSLMKHKGVVLLMGYTFFVILAYICSIYSLSAFAIAIGLTQSQGGNVSAVLQVGTAVGRPLMGVVSDRFGRITSALVVTAVNVVLNLAWWINIESYGNLVAYSLFLGMTSGTYWTVIAPLCAEVVELRDLPSTYVPVIQYSPPHPPQARIGAAYTDEMQVGVDVANGLHALPLQRSYRS
jgi:predicted MFS family arabinose efflux permease